MVKLEYIDLDDKKTILLCKSEEAAIFHCLLAQAKYRDPVEYAFKMPAMRIVGRSGNLAIPIRPNIERIHILCSGCTPLIYFPQIREVSKDDLRVNTNYLISVNMVSIAIYIQHHTIEAEDISWTLW